MCARGLLVASLLVAVSTPVYGQGFGGGFGGGAGNQGRQGLGPGARGEPSNRSCPAVSS